MFTAKLSYLAKNVQKNKKCANYNENLQKTFKNLEKLNVYLRKN